MKKPEAVIIPPCNRNKFNNYIHIGNMIGNKIHQKLTLTAPTDRSSLSWLL